MNTPVDDGAATTAADSTVNPVTVNIGGTDVVPAYADLSPLFAGLYQINVGVPNGITTGDNVSLTISLARQKNGVVQISVR